MRWQKERGGVCICIIDTSFVQLERHTFNRNGVTSKTKFSYMVLYTVITEKRKNVTRLYGR